jgi:hypothetical protein
LQRHTISLPRTGACRKIKAQLWNSRTAWAEKGAKPRKEKGSMTGGFGRTLIEQALPAALGAKTSFVLRKDGVYCSILLPLR